MGVFVGIKQVGVDPRVVDVEPVCAQKPFTCTHTTCAFGASVVSFTMIYHDRLETIHDGQ
jgi:hypothetical protein